MPGHSGFPAADSRPASERSLKSGGDGVGQTVLENSGLLGVSDGWSAEKGGRAPWGEGWSREEWGGGPGLVGVAEQTAPLPRLHRLRRF